MSELETGVHFGSIGNPLPNWRESDIVNEEDPDDGLIETPEDVIAILGFDPNADQPEPDGSTKTAAAISHKSMVGGFSDPRCSCKGDAEQTVRSDESESAIARFSQAMHKIFLSQRGDVIAHIHQMTKAMTKAEGNLSDIEKIIRGYDDQMASAVADFLPVIVADGGNAGLNAVNSRSAFNVANPEVEKFIREYSVRLAGAVNSTTVDKISATLGDGLSAGESVQELTARISALDDTAFSPLRSEMIARTESARAYVQGEIEGWDQSGVVQGKKWLLAPGACEFCQELAQQFNAKTVGLRDNFLSLGQTLVAMVDGEPKAMSIDYSDIPGPPLHPFDRCDVVPVMIDESGDVT